MISVHQFYLQIFQLFVFLLVLFIFGLQLLG